MKKLIELMRKFSSAIGIDGDGIHTFYSLILSIVFFHAGVWFEETHAVLAGFFAAIVITQIVGVLLEMAQGMFKIGEPSWRDIKCNCYGSAAGAILMLLLNLIF